MEDAEERSEGEAANERAKLGKAAIATGANAAMAGGIAGAVAGGPPGALIGAGVGFLGGTAGEVAKAMVESFNGATERLEKAAEHEKARALEEALPEIERQLSQLRALIEDERDIVSNVRAILHAWSRAWDCTGDAKKHRVLMTALVGTLDVDSYEAGMSIRLFRILEELDYAEIRFLRTAFSQGMGLVADLRGPQDTGPRRESETREHLDRLAAHRLVCWNESAASDDTKAIARTARRTWLGDRLLVLCADRDAINRAWPEAPPKA